MLRKLGQQVVHIIIKTTIQAIIKAIIKATIKATDKAGQRIGQLAKSLNFKIAHTKSSYWTLNPLSTYEEQVSYYFKGDFKI